MFSFNKATRILLGTNAMILLAGAMLGPIYALFVEDIGGDLLDASIAWGIFALAAGFTTLLTGKYADKIKQNELILVVGYILMGIGFALYLVVGSVMMLFFVQLVIGFAEAIYAPAFDALYSKHLAKTKIGRGWGAWEATDYFTAGAGAVVGGLIVTNFGFNTLFVVMALLSFASGLYIYLLPRRIL